MIKDFADQINVKPMHDTAIMYADAMAMNRLAKRYARTSQALTGSDHEELSIHYEGVADKIREAEAELLRFRAALMDGTI